MSTFERAVMAFLFGWIVTFTLLAGCSTTYRNVAKLETNWLGQVSAVEGGSATSNSPSAGWLTDVNGLIGNLSWFLIVGAIIFCLVVWKLPWLFRTIKASRAARAARS